jgi:hypothetical protein
VGRDRLLDARGDVDGQLLRVHRYWGVPTATAVSYSGM